MINWTELFDLQRELDDRILEEHGLEDAELMEDRVVAFLVELAEFANEGRFFKFWSKDQSPRRRVEILDAAFGVCGVADPLLEEFVDAVHFAIGIGLELGFTTFDSEHNDEPLMSKSATFLELSREALQIPDAYTRDGVERARLLWIDTLDLLWNFGHAFGITDDEIVAAYKAKHAENHARQDRGY